ncbi:putative transcription factor MYB/SANT family [Medicago truncatula]|uniref:Putative transcription factor MYB/SANT family n=1 Tax=Medicago truncatula TaxID=3880 RepID=A0A396IY63_MEDTR|nr:putative transcription factor MYB/SANT family [Medicago truncatula]
MKFPAWMNLYWSAGEEKLLIEAIDMYGFGNWNGVAENVGTKSKSQCIDHYNSVYLNSPCFPLPDLSYSMGKNKEELLAMAKGHQLKKGLLLDDRNHNLWRFCMLDLITFFIQQQSQQP